MAALSLAQDVQSEPLHESNGRVDPVAVGRVGRPEVALLGLRGHADLVRVQDHVAPEARHRVAAVGQVVVDQIVLVTAAADLRVVTRAAPEADEVDLADIDGLAVVGRVAEPDVPIEVRVPEDADVHEGLRTPVLYLTDVEQLAADEPERRHLLDRNEGIESFLGKVTEIEAHPAVEGRALEAEFPLSGLLRPQISIARVARGDPRLGFVSGDLLPDSLGVEHTGRLTREAQRAPQLEGLPPRGPEFLLRDQIGGG